MTSWAFCLSLALLKHFFHKTPIPRKYRPLLGNTHHCLETPAPGKFHSLHVTLSVTYMCTYFCQWWIRRQTFLYTAKMENATCVPLKQFLYYKIQISSRWLDLRQPACCSRCFPSRYLATPSDIPGASPAPCFITYLGSCWGKSPVRTDGPHSGT